MTERAELQALIERVEKLTGPDRCVDAEIMFDLFAKPVGKKDDGGPMGYLWPEDNPSWSFGIRFPGKDREWFAQCRKRIEGETLLVERDGAFVLMNSQRIPELTKSLDAATSVIERVRPEWAYGFDSGRKTHLAFVDPHDLADRMFGARHTAEAANSSIALILALLRSLEADLRAPAPSGGKR